MKPDQFWTVIFGCSAPVEIEIGAGRGAFLFAAATAVPAHNFLAIEHSATRAARLTRDSGQRALVNVRVLHADAGCVVEQLVPDNSVAAYHIYFPDPWWKRKHYKRRLFTPSFVAALGRSLAPGGRVYVATDVERYFQEIVGLLGERLQPDEAPRPHAIVTRFEQKALVRGATTHAAVFRKAMA
ncbi:MAG: tRNA (guanosine(46)-N7)-methyltransferase TrmB [Deltaproteobacteria bacterium]|nr:tRNA (guanosine(46)-N7)-methyltransferase TrmB [Deltaproteobacteria bacterium]MBI3389119.1 tRNA (guanosine(46)-N7)-methyltransferase TrmB [Deltaproteobacteria bacterium]